MNFLTKKMNFDQIQKGDLTLYEDGIAITFHKDNKWREERVVRFRHTPDKIGIVPFSWDGGKLQVYRKL